MPSPSQKRLKQDLKRTPPTIDRIYGEVIEAYNTGLDLLVLAGCRMILEGVCNERGIPCYDGSRELPLWERVVKLDSCFQDYRSWQAQHSFRPVESSFAESLAETTRWCNAAVHGLRIEESDDVGSCLNGIESALFFLYGLP
jgi:hypothetical protein